MIKGQQKSPNYGNIPDELVHMINTRRQISTIFLPYLVLRCRQELPPPGNLKEVRLGFLGPLEGSIIQPLGNKCSRALCWQLRKQIRKGVTEEYPLKLMIHNDVGLWGAAANEIVKMDDEGVWAWVGTIDDITHMSPSGQPLSLRFP
jgi:hypothetical protein